MKVGGKGQRFKSMMPYQDWGFVG